MQHTTTPIPHITTHLGGDNTHIRPRLEHTIIEIFGIEPALLQKTSDTLPLMERFIAWGGLKVMGRAHHDFTPQGTTIVFVLSSSHLAVHTWPELGYLHIDLLSCEDLRDPSSIGDIIAETFHTSDYIVKRVKYDDKTEDRT